MNRHIWAQIMVHCDVKSIFFLDLKLNFIIFSAKLKRSAFCGSAKFCCILKYFAEFYGILRKIQNWRFGTVCADLESSSFSLNFCNVL